jgi:hypothetical protein
MNILQRGLNLLQRVQTGVQKTLDQAQNTVGNAVRQGAEQGGQRLGQFVDGFEQQATQKASLLGGLFGDKSDLVHDGKLVGTGGQTFPPGTPLSQIPGVTPRDNPNPSTTILYVNGASNTLNDQSRGMQEIADTTGAKIIGVHNSTQGLAMDLIQCVKDKLDKGRNPAVDTMADTLYTELKAGRSVHVMGHSQGGIILSRALNDVANRLRLEDGLSKADTEKLLSKVNVETFGAASSHYPDGPNYVHYINKKDLVPTLFGLGSGDGLADFLKRPGRGAVVRHFEHGSGISGTHGLGEAYLPFRIPFDEARAGKS